MFDNLAEILQSGGVAGQLRQLGPDALVSVIGSSHRLESMLVARRFAAVAALLRQRLAATEEADAERGYAGVDAVEQTAAELAAVMNLSATAAGYLVSHAETLDTRLPKVAALLAQGRTDWRTVRLIITRTDLVSDEKPITRLDAELAARIGKWHGWSRQRIVNAVDAAVRAIDADAARERREHADDDRRIAITPLQDGMAEIYGTVAAAHATAFDRKLSELAKQVCRHDPRSMDQRRADALAALTAGRALACACGKPRCPTRAEEPDPDPGGRRAVISVVAGDQTLRGENDQPGYLDGYGVIDAEQVRELAAAASLRPADFHTTAEQQLRYQPFAALQRAVRCRDLTCRFPGCSRPAVVCDLDHTVPFNHANPAAGGRTVPENLKCLCRLHHRLKTSAQNLLGLARPAAARRHRHLDLTRRAQLPHRTRRRRSVPAIGLAGDHAGRTGMRGAHPEPAQPIQAARRPDRPGPQAQSPPAAHQPSPPPPQRGPQGRDRRAQVPQPHA